MCLASESIWSQEVAADTGALEPTLSVLTQLRTRPEYRALICVCTPVQIRCTKGSLITLSNCTHPKQHIQHPYNCDKIALRVLNIIYIKYFEYNL